MSNDNQDTAKMLQAAMEAVDQAFNAADRPKKVGIVMLVFPYGATDGQANYISNGAERRDMVALFKETAARFEGSPHVTGNA